MNTLQIQNISVDELKTIIADSVEQKFQSLLPKEKPQVIDLTRQQDADSLGISLVTLHKRTKNGILRGYRINTRVRYKSDEVDKALEEVGSIMYRRY